MIPYSSGQVQMFHPLWPLEPPPSPAPGAGWTVSTPKVLFISSPRPSISAMNEPVDFLFYIGIPAIPQDTLVEPVVRSQLVCPLWRETAKDLEAQLRF